MLILAQAAAEYGALGSGSSANTSALLNRINSAGPEEYLIAAVVVVVAIGLIMKLLDAA